MDTVNARPSTSILVIEDDQAVANLLSFMFTREGMQVICVTDGSLAQHKINTLYTPPQLVLLDLILPYVDGFELLRQIRRKPAWRDVPVMVLSAKSQEHDIIRAFKLGASDYVVKPLQIGELIARAHHLLDRNAK